MIPVLRTLRYDILRLSRLAVQQKEDIKRGFLPARNVNTPVKRRGCPGYSLNPGKYALYSRALASKKHLRESLARVLSETLTRAKNLARENR